MQRMVGSGRRLRCASLAYGLCEQEQPTPRFILQARRWPHRGYEADPLISNNIVCKRQDEVELLIVTGQEARLEASNLAGDNFDWVEGSKIPTSKGGSFPTRLECMHYNLWH